MMINGSLLRSIHIVKRFRHPKTGRKIRDFLGGGGLEGENF